jgi:hypothetical protein
MVKISPGDGKRSVMRIAAVHAFTSHPPREKIRFIHDKKKTSINCPLHGKIHVLVSMI